MPAWKLLQGDLALVQIPAEGLRVQFFTRPDWGCVGIERHSYMMTPERSSIWAFFQEFE